MMAGSSSPLHFSVSFQWGKCGPRGNFRRSHQRDLKDSDKLEDYRPHSAEKMLCVSHFDFN